MTESGPKAANVKQTAPRDREVELTSRLARHALGDHGAAALFDEAVELIKDHLGVDAAYLLRQVPTGEGFTMQAATGWTQASAREVVVPRLAGSQVDFVAGQDKVVRIDDLRREDRFTPMPFLLDNGIRSTLAAPIHTTQGTDAIIAAHSRRKRRFTDEEAAFLGSVAEVIQSVFERQDTEAALAASEERLRMAIQAGGMGAWEWQISTGKVIWSEELERIHGLASQTFPGTFEAYQQDIHPEDRIRVIQAIQNSVETGSHELEYRIVRPDGDIRWLSNRGHLTRDSDGRPVRMVGICTDVTDSKKADDERERLFGELEATEARYRSVFSAAGDAILLTNSLGQYVDVNPAAERLLGYSQAELKHLHVSDLVESGLAWTEDEFRQFITEGSWHREVKLRRKDGRIVDVEAHATAIMLPPEPRFVAVIRDISERKRTEEALARAARQQAAVAELGLAALSVKNLQELMDEAVQTVASTLGVEFAKVLEWLPEQNELIVQSGIGWKEGVVGQARVTTEPESQAGYTLTVDDPVIVTSLENDTRFRGTQLLHDHGVKSGISIIIRLPGRAYGVLSAHATVDREYSQDEINFVQAVANILSAAIERQQNSQELQRLVFQLEMERQRVDNLVANVPGIVWEAYGEPDGESQRIAFISGHAEEMLGYTVEEWLSTPNFWLTIVHPDDRERAAQQATDEFLAGKGGRNEFRWIARDGRVVWVESQSTIIRDNEGNPIGMRGVTMDITARRQSDRRLREYAWTLETINRINLSLSQELDLRNAVQQVTDAATRLTSAELGWFVYARTDRSEAQMQYATPGEGGTWATPADETGVRQFLEVLRRAGPIRCADVALDERCASSITYLNEAAQHIVASLIAIPIYTRKGDVLGGLVLTHTGTDVFSERAEQVALSLAAQATIAIENAMQFEESQRLLEEVRKANESKDEFLGLVSHELRTPITTIYGGTRLLRSRGASLDEASQKTILEDIERETDRLYRIVEDLLVLARAELGETIEMEPVLMRRVAQRTIVSYARRRPRRRIELRTDSQLAPIQASAFYLDQVLRNLISNADKYSPADEPIDVWVRREGNEIVVSVMDRGPGLPQQEMDLIFERFYRASETAGKVSGAGIGLTVCKRLMDAQGGRIWAEPRDGGGLGISLALPIVDETDLRDAV